MMTSKRTAFVLAIAVHILLLYALSNSGAHLLRYKEAGKQLFVTLLLPRPISADTPSQHRQEVPPSAAPEHTIAARGAMHDVAHSVTPAAASTAIVVETKEEAVVPPMSGSAVPLAQSVLNAIGKMDQDEQRGTRSGANVLSNSLEARLSGSMEKYAPVKAGTIDEHIYPDGRREERIHTPFGGEVCITYESPANPVDGFDTMQRGIKPSVPHTCGHRFD